VSKSGIQLQLHLGFLKNPRLAVACTGNDAHAPLNMCLGNHMMTSFILARTHCGRALRSGARCCSAM
jgi:hypothetical protein